MKTLKTIGLLLLTAVAAWAQPNPDNMFISGYVVDGSGLAQNNQQVCVAFVSNNPVLPSDTVCTTTNANGYYFIEIQNGSVSGPNVTYEVSTVDPCSFVPLTQIRQNYQGTIDTANVNFTICANSISCDASFTATVDSSSGFYVYTFQANGSGQAPLSYEWWIDGAVYTTPTVIHTFLGGTVGVYLTVTGADSCQAFAGDTLYLDGNPNGCSAAIQAVTNLNNELELSAMANGVPPFSYIWNTGHITPTVVMPFQPGVYCVSVTDATGCTVTTCDTVSNPSQGCSVNITTTVDSTSGGLVYTLTASGGFATYDWIPNGAVGQSITVLEQELNGQPYCVVATSSSGCTATACDTLLPISSGNCFADFWYQTSNPNTPIYAGNTVQFNYSGSMAQYNYYFWSVQGAGLNMNAYDQNPSFTFPSAGIYQVCVEVFDSLANCSDTYCETIQVLSGNTGGCQAYFTWEESNITGSPLPVVEFTDQSQGANYWFWDFGDNTTSTDQNPLHTYSGSGLYLVCLTIVNADQSCQQTFCDSVYVGNWGNGGCNASFSSSGPTPIGYTFSANVQNPNINYYWTIDNQFVSSGYQANAPALGNGVHTICLMVIDSLNNCSDNQCLTITVGGNNCYGYISGQLYAGSNNQPLDQGVVYLITYDANTNQLTAVDSMVVDSGNYYFFGPLACGNYLIKAAAYPGSQYYSNYIPTYYGTSPFWGFAQTVSLGQANTQVTADIFLIGANNPGGPGFIGGDVTQGANKVDPGDALEGMQVM
ncbi:MAG: PKD domain-containing protein, partial [Flavobacteriales bacterium]|nr:PKD domain-containing protein [Flavobacteriales bacterium]